MKKILAAYIALALSATGCTSMQSDGWITLLDGDKGLENWQTFGGANWRIVDGVLTADSGPKGSSFFMTKNAYADFVLRAEFWVSHDANSGLYMRCLDLKSITDKTCTEANIFDERPDPKFGTGAITHLSPIANMPKAGGKWNVYEITARGPNMTVVLNGMQTAQTDHANVPSGPIGLQWAQGVVKFRKVQIKPL